MATKDGRTQIWYADGNGNVEGYTETVDDIAETIIGTYNEHFGTDIQLWTPETETLQVGGTVPNWSAYEKIEMPQSGVKIIMPNATEDYCFGSIEGTTFKLVVNNAGRYYIVKASGIILAVGDGSTGFAEQYVKPKLIENGYEVDTIETETIQYEIGDTIPNWESYTIVS